MSMTREEIFAAWVPDLPEDGLGMPWTCWAKPVLFANLGIPTSKLPGDQPTHVATEREMRPSASERFAVVIDLPGAESVARGMEFAELGFRLVPLFNGCPGSSELVDTSSIRKALKDSAERLRELSIPIDAPPAFLLDSRRMTPNGAIRAGRFDNRWLTLPQDFPSANLLLARGILKALLIQETNGQPKDDLAHVLRRWQEAGIQIANLCGSDDFESEPLDIRKPSRFRSLWYRLGAMVGLRPNSTGGFGGVIPQPSSG